MSFCVYQPIYLFTAESLYDCFVNVAFPGYLCIHLRTKVLHGLTFDVESGMLYDTYGKTVLILLRLFYRVCYKANLKLDHAGLLATHLQHLHLFSKQVGMDLHVYQACWHFSGNRIICSNVWLV